MSLRVRLLTGLIVAISLAGCRSSAALNRPLETSQATALAPSLLASSERSGRILLALTFSGGGTRAAALSYGALQGLAATTVRISGGKRRLIDEVDLISSVSGGSFTAP